MVSPYGPSTSASVDTAKVSRWKGQGFEATGSARALPAGTAYPALAGNVFPG